MDLTDIPDDAYTGDEQAPDLDELETPDSFFTEGPVRERLLDVITGIRDPTKVAEIAELADCDTETARDYLEWFDEMGLVRRHGGRPVQYERNDTYFEWRRVERIRQEYTDEEIVDALSDTFEQIEAYREQFDTDSPNSVSLVEASQEMPTEEAWEALSEWETLERRARVLDAARRDHPSLGDKPDPVDV